MNIESMRIESYRGFKVADRVPAAAQRCRTLRAYDRPRTADCHEAAALEPLGIGRPGNRLATRRQRQRGSSRLRGAAGRRGFVLPLNAAGAAGASSVASWGSGEYRSLSGESGTLDWDGALVGVHLGVDVRPREELLAGVAVSWLASDLDYEDATAAAGGGLGEGAYTVELTGVHPYLGWRAGEGVEVWATAGVGEELGEAGMSVAAGIALRKGRTRKTCPFENATTP